MAKWLMSKEKGEKEYQIKLNLHIVSSEFEVGTQRERKKLRIES